MNLLTNFFFFKSFSKTFFLSKNFTQKNNFIHYFTNKLHMLFRAGKRQHYLSFNLNWWFFFDFFFDFLQINIFQNNLSALNFNFFLSKFVHPEIIFNKIVLNNLDLIKGLNSQILNKKNKCNFSRNYTYFSYLESFDTVSASIFNNNILGVRLPPALTPVELEKLDKQLMINIDKLFWSQVWKKSSYFSYLPDLYEFWDYTPFTKNNKFEEQIYRLNNLEDYFSIGYHWVTSDLKSFYYEPFYFFWNKPYQNMDTYRLVSFFWQRTLLLEEWLFPNHLSQKDKPIFKPLAQFYHKSEFKSGLKILRRINNYKDYSVYPYYLNFDDFQQFAIDKNFLHIWNYWLGASHQLNVFASKYSIGSFNILREKIYTPKAHAISKFIWKDVGYKTYNFRLINFSFFPDMGMMWGHFNPSLDQMTTGYNWFFHSGDNFMDATLSLKFIWYQLTYNLWGPFDYLAIDYSWFQPTYFPDQMASIRVPLILLVCKNYPNLKQMGVLIKDYDNAFQFKKFKKYQTLTAENYFKLSWLSRLESLRDPITVTSKIHPFEWLVNLFYGYNPSECIANYPSWYSDIMNSLNFYSSLTYNYDEDKFQEDRVKQIVKSFAAEKNNFLGDLSIYFNKTAPIFPLRTFFHFINEKLYDDIGYLYTSKNRGDLFKTISNLNWLKDISFIFYEMIPIPHYSWNLLNWTKFDLDWFSFGLPKFLKILTNLHYDYNTFIKINLKRTGFGFISYHEVKGGFGLLKTVPFYFPNSFGFDLNLIYFNWALSFFLNEFSNNFIYYLNKTIFYLDFQIDFLKNQFLTIFTNFYQKLVKISFVEMMLKSHFLNENLAIIYQEILAFIRFNFFKLLASLYVTSWVRIYIPFNFFFFKNNFLAFFFNFYFIDILVDVLNFSSSTAKIDKFFLSKFYFSCLSISNTLKANIDLLFDKFKFFDLNLSKSKNLYIFNILPIYFPLGFAWYFFISQLIFELKVVALPLIIYLDKELNIVLSNKAIITFLQTFFTFVVIPHKEIEVRLHLLKNTPYSVASISFHNSKFIYPQIYFFYLTLYSNSAVNTIHFDNNKFQSMPFFIKDFFLNIKTDQDYYWFVLLLTVYELNWSTHIDSKLEKFVPVINSIDSKNLKLSTLEYQRYINYVLKQKTYKKY